jgi:hypothetical protein
MKFLDEGVHQKEEMFDQKNLVKKRYVLNETVDSAGTNGGGSDVPVSE